MENFWLRTKRADRRDIQREFFLEERKNALYQEIGERGGSKRGKISGVGLKRGDAGKRGGATLEKEEKASKFRDGYKKKRPN